MAINDLIARGSTRSPGQAGKEFTDTVTGIVNFRQKVAEYNDYQAEKPARQAEYGERRRKSEIASEVMDEHKPNIKQAAKLKVDNEIATLEQQNQWIELEGIDSVLQGIRDDETYNLVVDQVPPATLKKYGIDPQKSYKENQTALSYLSDRVQHSLKQRQELEKLQWKGEYAARSAAANHSYTPDPLGELPSGAEFGQVMLNLESDPAFSGSYLGMFTNPGNSAEFQQAASMVAAEYQSLKKENADRNRRATDAGLPPIRISESDAIAAAKAKTKAYLFDKIDTPFFGGSPQVELLSPEEAQAREDQWRRQALPYYMQDPEFAKADPTEQERILRKNYMRERMMEYNLSQQRHLGRINSR